MGSFINDFDLSQILRQAIEPLFNFLPVFGFPASNVRPSTNTPGTTYLIGLNVMVFKSPVQDGGAISARLALGCSVVVPGA